MVGLVGTVLLVAFSYYAGKAVAFRQVEQAVKRRRREYWEDQA